MVRSVEAKSTLPFLACWSPPDLARGSFGVSRRASSRRGGAETAALQQQEGQDCATSPMLHGADDLQMPLGLDEHDGASQSSMLNENVEDFTAKAATNIVNEQGLQQDAPLCLLLRLRGGGDDGENEVSVPPACNEWVSRSFGHCKSDEQRKYVEESLKERIGQAASSEKLWSIDWKREPRVPTYPGEEIVTPALAPAPEAAPRAAASAPAPAPATTARSKHQVLQGPGKKRSKGRGSKDRRLARRAAERGDAVDKEPKWKWPCAAVMRGPYAQPRPPPPMAPPANWEPSGSVRRPQTPPYGEVPPPALPPRAVPGCNLTWVRTGPRPEGLAAAVLAAAETVKIAAAAVSRATGTHTAAAVPPAGRPVIAGPVISAATPPPPAARPPPPGREAAAIDREVVALGRGAPAPHTRPQGRTLARPLTLGREAASPRP